MNYVAIIPARKNSKRIKNKNIRKINGKYLVNYTIDAAKKVNKISKIVVTTDIDKILKKNKGKLVYLKRPSLLSKDTSTTESAMFHALNYLKEKENINPRNIILLQPTSPFRDKNDITNAINKYEKGKYDSLFSGFVAKILIWKKNRNNFKPLNYKLNKRKKGQDSKRMIIENGAIFISNYKKFLLNKNRLFGK